MSSCQHRDPNNVGRYCLDRVIGDRTWRGTAHDIDVSDFVRQHENDIIITFENARAENEAIIIDFPNTGITYNGGWCSATIPR